MLEAILQIESAIKGLYRISVPFCSKDFLLEKIPAAPLAQPVSHASLKGALFIQHHPSQSEELNLGIYLDPSVRAALDNFPSWEKGKWTLEQTQAFNVATEEISHFLYLTFHVLNEKPVTELEMELQAEIDKFLLTYFANRVKGEENSLFESLFEALFYNYSLSENLSDTQKQRYEEANCLARRYLHKRAEQITQTRHHPVLFDSLRAFYRQKCPKKLEY